MTVPSAPAQFNPLNNSVNLNFGDAYLDGVRQPGLQGAATFSLSSQTCSNGTTNWTCWTFTIDTLANTPGGSFTNSRLVSSSFDVASDIASASATGMFDLSRRNSSIFNGISV